jgi:hypothetical protein
MAPLDGAIHPDDQTARTTGLFLAKDPGKDSARGIAENAEKQETTKPVWHTEAQSHREAGSHTGVMDAVWHKPRVGYRAAMRPNQFTNTAHGWERKPLCGSVPLCDSLFPFFSA